jgi:hypothetical protein
VVPQIRNQPQLFRNVQETVPHLLQALDVQVATVGPRLAYSEPGPGLWRGEDALLGLRGDFVGGPADEVADVELDPFRGGPAVEPGLDGRASAGVR